MGKITLKDRSKEFEKRSDFEIDMALAEMATDILRMGRGKVPYFQGRLRASGRFNRLGQKRYKVGYYTTYAGYQEFGQRKDGSRQVTRYRLGGTGAGFLRETAQGVANNAKQYLRKAGQRASRMGI